LEQGTLVHYFLDLTIVFFFRIVLKIVFFSISQSFYFFRAGFAACGICPLNMDRVLSKLPPEDSTRNDIQDVLNKQLVEELKRNVNNYAIFKVTVS
jgi:hypothetical protein